MRQIYIDLTTEKIRPPSFIGYIGEHNATELLITIPQELVDTADYQVVVFESGPILIRSRNIDEDKTKSCYRIGNVIHYMLGKELTKQATLGLQIEAYAINEFGDAAFVGKTAFLSKLSFKLSPQGSQTVSAELFQDIQKAVDKSHGHFNAATISKLGTKDGKLTYDGEYISYDLSSIKRYDYFSALPASAENGTLAFVDNDEYTKAVPDAAMKCDTEYSSFRVRENFEDNLLNLLEDVVVSDELNGVPIRECGFEINDSDTSNGICSIELMYVENMVSLLVAGDLLLDKIDRAYVPGGMSESNEDIIYAYNFIDNFDTSVMTGADEPLICPKGWFKFFTKKSNYRIENDRLQCDSEMAIEPIDFSKSNVAVPFANKRVLCRLDNEDILNHEKLEQLLNGIFRVETGSMNSKGLYVFCENQWKLLNNEPLIVAETYLDLPKTATEGALAYIKKSAYIYSDEDGVYPSPYGGWREIHLNPHLSSKTWLFDFELSFARGYDYVDSYTYATQFQTTSGGFELVTNVGAGYVLCSVSPYEWSSAYDLYIYSRNTQTINFQASTAILNNENALNIEVAEGWNRLFVDGLGALVAEPITRNEDLPVMTASGSNYFKRAKYRSPSFSSDSFFVENIVNNVPYFAVDNARGLWGFFNGNWIQIDTEADYTYEV